MKQFYTLLFFCLGMMFVGCSDDDKNEPQLPGEPGTEVPDGGEFNPENVGLEYDDGTNCAFNVKIAIDKEGMGNERCGILQKPLEDRMGRHTNASTSWTSRAH